MQAIPPISSTGGTGEAWTRAVPSQTRVPAPKAASADGIWVRGSRYSGIGSSGLYDAYKDRLTQLEGQSQAAKAERAKNTEELRLLYGSQAWDAEQRQYELNRQISGMDREMDSLRDRIRKGEHAMLLQQGYRPMSLLDATVQSAKQGYYNSRYGEESFHDMFGSGSDKQKYGDILAGEEYRYTTDNPVLEAVSGAAQLLGQQVRQWTNPQTLAMAGGAAGAAALAGQAGPQVLLPEEILTVPSAAIAGFKTGSSLSNFQIEAGLAYNEMLEKGVSPETAQKIAIGVGGINAALEFAQLDELLDAYKAVRNNPATKTVSQRIFQELLDRGVDVGGETLQEIAQEGVTIAGTQLGSKLDKGEWAYSGDEVLDRLGETGISSALSFGVLNLPAAGRNVSGILRNTGAESGTMSGGTAGQTETGAGTEAPNYRSATGQAESGRQWEQKNSATPGDGGTRYALKSFDKDGQRFVDVQTDQEQFDGLSEREQGRVATQIIKKRFAGRVIGIDNRVFVNGRSASEYGFPVKHLGTDLHEAKMRASTELDNLMDAGTNFRTEPDGKDGHVHSEATGDFLYFDTIFKVGKEYYKGTVNIMQTKRGLLLKDVTQIENVTQAISSSYGENPQATILRDVSMGNVPQGGGAVNEKFSPEDGTVAKTTEALTREGPVSSSQAEMEGRGAADAESPDGGNDWRRMGSLPPEPFLEGYFEDEGFASWSGADSGLVLDSYVAEALHGQMGQDCRHLNAVCKALGVRARFVEAIPGMRNAEARIAGNEILIAKDHQHPLRFVLGHELLHRMQALAPEQYRAFQECAVQERGAPSAVEDKLGLYAGSRVALDYEGALDEITADYAGELFENGRVLDEFIRRHRADRTLLERLRDAFRDLIGKLTGAERRYAQTAEGKLTAVLEESARQVERDTQNAARRGGGEQYIIMQTADGRKYVRADRPVMFGFDPEDWREQLETYINNKIRRGEDVQLIAEDGEVLSLTKDSAGKLASPYTSKGTTLPEDTYYTKVNAGAHIDELAQISKRGQTRADLGRRHGKFASRGWNYRTAYFQDYNGKYYRIQISVAQGENGNVVYNIGDIKERSLPTTDFSASGSSAKGGAQGGETSSTSSVTQDGGGVKPQYSLRDPAGAAGIEGPALGWTAPAQGADPRLADLRAAYEQKLLFPRTGGDPLAWMYFLQMGQADRGDEEAFRALYEDYMRRMGGTAGGFTGDK